MTHLSPSRLTARLAWERRSARGSRSHARRQLGQRQFHCGKPPPAAEPRTRKRTSRRSQTVYARFASRSDLGGSVGGDFHADADFADFGSGPGHCNLLRFPPSYSRFAAERAIRAQRARREWGSRIMQCSDRGFPSSRPRCEDSLRDMQEIVLNCARYSAASACGNDDGQDFSRSRKSATSQRPARPSGRARGQTT